MGKCQKCKKATKFKCPNCKKTICAVCLIKGETCNCGFYNLPETYMYQSKGEQND